MRIVKIARRTSVFMPCFAALRAAGRSASQAHKSERATVRAVQRGVARRGVRACGRVRARVCGRACVRAPPSGASPLSVVHQMACCMLRVARCVLHAACCTLRVGCCTVRGHQGGEYSFNSFFSPLSEVLSPASAVSLAPARMRMPVLV